MAIPLLAAAFALSGCWPTLVAAAPTQQCCTLLAREFPEDVTMPNTTSYDFQNHNFWSATEVLDPWCVFLPDTKEKVAQAVKLFVGNNCTFSIKGGGHSAIPGAANIHDGILVPTKKLNSIEINPEGGSVRVGMGVTMGDIYAALDKHNQVAMIGRYEKVGCGVTLGAGFSYLFNQQGFSVDNVLDFEVVLADGSIVNANATSHSDLFRALKGGSNNFGFVTAITLATVQTEGAIYGGIMYYAEEYLDRVSDVIYDYHVRQAVEDTWTHALPQYGYNGTTNTSISFNPIVYNRNVTALPEIMQGWLDIPAYKNTLKNQQYHDLSVELNDGFPDGLVQEQRVFTVYADAQLYKDVWARYHAWLQNYQHIPGFYGLHVNMPITQNAMVEGFNKGGNVLGLESARNGTLGVLYFGLTFDNMSDAPEVLPAHDAFVKEMEALAKSRGLLHPYIMLTYSGWNQPAIASYGADNVKHMLDVQAQYDPNRVFQKLVPGGQKLPAN